MSAWRRSPAPSFSQAAQTSSRRPGLWCTAMAWRSTRGWASDDPPVDARPQPVFGASGGAAAFRLAAFSAVGGFAEAFFMYLEDVDLAWRLRSAGWSAVWAPQAVATHAYSASAGEGSALKRRLLARNRIWTLARCLPKEAWQRDWRSIVVFDCVAMLGGCLRGDWAATRGRIEGLVGLPLRLLDRTMLAPVAYQGEGAVVGWDNQAAWIAPASGLAPPA